MYFFELELFRVNLLSHFPERGEVILLVFFDFLTDFERDLLVDGLGVAMVWKG